MALVRELVLAANLNGHPLHVVTEEGWTARPIVTAPLQTGPVSCSLWVLAGIAAILQGHHLPSLTKSDMLTLHRSLYRQVLYLPSAL